VDSLNLFVLHVCNLVECYSSMSFKLMLNRLYLEENKFPVFKFTVYILGFYVRNMSDSCTKQHFLTRPYYSGF
jgi:hypothetical protein